MVDMLVKTVEMKAALWLNSFFYYFRRLWLAFIAVCGQQSSKLILLIFRYQVFECIGDRFGLLWCASVPCP